MSLRAIHLAAFVVVVSASPFVYAAQRAVPAEYTQAVKIELTRAKVAEKNAATSLNVQYDGAISRLKYADLVAAGLPASVDSRTLRLFDDGTEQAIYVYDANSDNVFDAADYVMFFGRNHTATQYAYTNPYWLVWGGSQGKRMDVRNTATATTATPSYTATKIVERNEALFNKLGWREPWMYSSYFSVKSNKVAVPKTYTFSLNSTAYTGADGKTLAGKLKVTLPSYLRAGAVDTNFSFTVTLSLNNVQIAQQTITNVGAVEIEGTFSANVIKTGDTNNSVVISVSSVNNTGITDAVSGNTIPWIYMYLDKIEVTYGKKVNLTYTNQGLFGTDTTGAQTLTVSGIGSSDYAVLDVTDPINPVRVTSASLAGSVLTVRDTPTKATQYACSTATAMDTNSTIVLRNTTIPGLTSADNEADFIVIIPCAENAVLTDSSLYKTLTNVRTGKLSWMQRRVDVNGLAVKVVRLNDIYDEFSYGLPMPSAIRDFLKFTYSSWKKKPSYVMFVGDATADYRNDLGTSLTTQVPTYLVDNKDIVNDSDMGYIASDDWFVCFDGDDDTLPDMMSGRLPYSTSTTLQYAVDKIVDYETTSTDTAWTKKILLYSGAESTFVNLVDELQSTIPTSYSVMRMPTAAAADSWLGFEESTKSTMLGQMQSGALIVNYSGHGNVDLWGTNANTALDTFSTTFPYTGTSSALGFTNLQAQTSAKASVFVSLSCLNGYFIGSTRGDSLAELWLGMQNKGAAAVFAASGVSIPTYQQLMAKGFFDAVFVKGDRIIGSAVLRAKKYLATRADSFSAQAARAFMLFGDPAMTFPLGGIGDASDVTAEQILAETENVPTGTSAVAASKGKTVVAAYANNASSVVNPPIFVAADNTSSGVSVVDNLLNSVSTPSTSSVVSVQSTARSLAVSGKVETATATDNVARQISDVLASASYRGDIRSKSESAPRGTSLLNPRATRSDGSVSGDLTVRKHAPSEALEPRDAKGYFKKYGMTEVKTTGNIHLAVARPATQAKVSWFAQIGEAIAGLFKAIWHAVLRLIGLA